MKMGKNRKTLSYATKIEITVDHAGRCAFCGLTGKKIYTNSKEKQQLDSFNIGEFAHIHSETPGGPRYDKKIDKNFLSSKDNFLLLCSNHHHMIDDDPEKYPATELKQKRIEHVELVQKRLNISISNRIVVVVLRDDYFGNLNTSTIQASLVESDFVVNYLDIRTQTKTTKNIEWNTEFKLIKKKWDNYYHEFLKNVHSMIDCNHIYCITQIPYAFYFGLLLKDTNKYIVHQWNRVEHFWEGTSDQDFKDDFIIKKDIKNKDEDIILKIELSANIEDELIYETSLTTRNLVSISIESPSRLWLRSEKQTQLFMIKYRLLMEELNRDFPNSHIHLFYAGPISPIIHIGASYNPRMDNPLYIYYFQADPNRIRGKYLYVCNTHDLLKQNAIQ